MMRCSNTETYRVEREYNVMQIEVRCGTTDPYGERCLCEQCRNDPLKRAEHERILRLSNTANAWLRSAGWGEM